MDPLLLKVSSETANSLGRKSRVSFRGLRIFFCHESILFVLEQSLTDLG